ncbi:MAG: two-component regulator propeller domain-containing protein [Myxococcota bacterium]
MGATQKLLAWWVVACCVWGSCVGTLQASESKTPEKQGSEGRASASVTATRADQGSAVFQRLSIEEGLSQSEVNTLAFDREGYLWIGTQDGLNRYDGTQFEVFRHDPRDTSSISHDFIHSVVIDHAGEVWFNTKTGFDRWDPLRRAFERYQLPLLPGKKEAEPVVLLHPYKRGGLYIVSNSSALYYLPPGEKVPQQLSKPSESVTLIRELVKVVLAEDNHLDLWFATQSVPLMRYRPSTQEFLPIPTDKELPEGWGGGTLFDIYPQKDGTLWLASEKGLFYRPADTLRFLPVTVPFQHGTVKRCSFISCIETGPGSTLWLGTTEGLFSVDTVQHTVKSIPFLSPVSEPGRYITSIHTDKQGMLWVGTLSFSIHRYDPQAQALIEYQDTRGEVLPQDGMMVMALTSDDAGNLWMGGMGALWKISRNRDVFFNLLHDTKREPSLSDPMV